MPWFGSSACSQKFFLKNKIIKLIPKNIVLVKAFSLVWFFSARHIR
jgi:hypothetical protein